MSDEMTSPASEAAGPAAVPSQGHHPAGWASASHTDRAQRAAMRTAILVEREEQARAELEAEIDRRLNAARGVPEGPSGLEDGPDRPVVRVIQEGQS